ncbi:hypothetical protein [Spiroplasma taiwanense]|uniref:Lipoprotein n=1 Tax=Spiroplasma taiwanense CT-1 TaxID=1276220 RepID=S5MIH8_9MOLU|nr:hypothetical protein [Spiroplasma taiwanense]AGR41700.1 hypothetical protein STAIW_v1c11170 [Spiroplasma taiwanense CT-1]
MKKILGLMGTLGTIVSSGSFVVACSDNTTEKVKTVEDLIAEYNNKNDRLDIILLENDKDDWTNYKETLFLYADLYAISYEIILLNPDWKPEEGKRFYVASKEELIELLNALKKQVTENPILPNGQNVSQEFTNYIDSLINKYE